MDRQINPGKEINEQSFTKKLYKSLEHMDDISFSFFFIFISF